MPQTIHKVTVHRAVELSTKPVLTIPRTRTRTPNVRSGLSLYVPSTFPGKVLYALLNVGDAPKLADAVKATVFGEIAGGVPCNVPAGEDVDVWAWTDSGTVQMIVKSLVMKGASR